MTDEQKATRVTRSRAYRSTLKGRAVFKAASYRNFDKARGFSGTVTWEFLMQSILTAPCFYCGEVLSSGCDRIDNTKGHSATNVVPCCNDCNTARSDNFTHEEMRAIGAAIRLVKLARAGRKDWMHFEGCR